MKVGHGSECKTESESNSALVRSINFQTKVSNGGDDDANFALIVSMESREFMVQIVLITRPRPRWISSRSAKLMSDDQGKLALTLIVLLIYMISASFISSSSLHRHCIMKASSGYHENLFFI